MGESDSGREGVRDERSGVLRILISEGAEACDEHFNLI